MTADDSFALPDNRAGGERHAGCDDKRDDPGDTAERIMYRACRLLG
jgi:hypothetical protein